MRILAVDATTFRQSVAVVHDGQVLAEVRLASRAAHSRRLMPAIDFLLRTLEVDPRTIDGYAVTTGPGSFTGVRVGLSTVQGLALAADKPVLGVSSLDVLAAKAAQDAPADGAFVIVPIVESERGEVYAGFYDAKAHATREPQNAPLELVLQQIAEAQQPAILIGDGAEKHAEVIAAACPGSRPSGRSSFLAAVLGVIAEPRLAAGEGIHPRELRPLYLRGAHLWGMAPQPMPPEQTRPEAVATDNPE